MSKQPPRKPSHVRVVLLKEAPQQISLYKSCEMEKDHSYRIPIDPRWKRKKMNKSSLVYLSSMLQDGNIESSLIEGNLQRSEPTEIQEDGDVSLVNIDKYMRLSTKRGKRHLSVIINSDSKKDQRYLRSKTQSIDQVIAEKKIRPIDRLKIGLKNLNFSQQNKLDLNEDFQQFISKKKNQKGIEECEAIQPKKKSTILFMKREDLNIGSPSSHHECIRKMNSGFKSINSLVGDFFSVQIPKKKKKQEKNSISLLKRAKNGMPVAKNFRWSRVNNDIFNLNKK